MRSEHAETAKRILTLALTASKTQTIKGIYERIKPGPDGRIRTVLSVVGTETSRLSSSDSFVDVSTNLLNIPNKTALLDPLFDVRRCIVAAPGYVLIEIDKSQAEARVVSAYARDDETLAIFDDPTRDVHKWTAANIFGCAESEVSKSQRYLGKMARHALNYGMGWALFLERINKDADLTGIAINAATAKRIVSAYHDANPKLLAWWAEVCAEVKRNGYVVNPYGRRRDFLSPYVRPNDIIAQLPQSTIADHVLIGMVNAFEAGVPLSLETYDGILVEVPEEDVDATKAALRRCLDFPIKIGDYQLRVPTDVKSGLRWSDLE